MNINFCPFCQTKIKYGKDYSNDFSFLGQCNSVSCSVYCFTISYCLEQDKEKINRLYIVSTDLISKRRYVSFEVDCDEITFYFGSMKDTYLSIINPGISYLEEKFIDDFMNKINLTFEEALLFA